MAQKYMTFTEDSIAFMIACTVLNRYDFYVIIDANRGVGKSSLAYRLAKRISKIFRKLYKGDIDTIMSIYKLLSSKRKDLTLDDFILQILMLKQKRAYIFTPQTDLIYDQQSAKEFLQGWQGIGVFDEFINIGYSRDFFDKGQKDLIKMINLNRDHNHVIIACVPHFSTIDNQLRNLSRMRIYLKERGFGVIMQPNKGMSIRDKWDMDLNEKIERKWLEKKVKYPKWNKLTTFRGIIKTRPLTAADEAIYQKIKDEKRATIMQDQMNVKSPQEKKQESFDNVLHRLINNEIKSYDELDGIAAGIDMKPSTLKRKLRETLRDQGKASRLDVHFFDKDKAIEEVKQKKMNKIASVENIDLSEGMDDILEI